MAFKSKWKNLSIKRKMILAFVLTSAVMFAINICMYWQVNQTIRQIDQVYISNLSLNELSQAFEKVQSDMYSYLRVKSSNSLSDYYRSEQAYREKIEQLNKATTDNEMLMLEKNIRNMSENYLELAGDTVQSKRGRNVVKYNESYEEASRLYNYINTYIYRLNNLHFMDNATSYTILVRSLQYMELVSSVILVVITILNILVLTVLVNRIIMPLAKLADNAVLVGEGNFEVTVGDSDSKDEVGVLTRAFNKMVYSLKIYMDKTRESMEKEQKMKEQELLMEAHLKDAQLKYLQAQINPHFLFNSLNAGVQLSMMENAEKTSLFIERMADFFRYNVKKVTEDTTLREELEAVDNYIYILNVRFAGDIHFTKEVDEDVLDEKMPSMLLQPIVENAVNHGIRNVEWEGKIHLQVKEEGDMVRIAVRDNGKGISQMRIRQVLEGALKDNDSASTGIGMDNVIHRLELYYDRKNLMEIISDGEDKGTEVILMLPREKQRG